MTTGWPYTTCQMAPDLAQALEERERDDLFRLKRVKMKLTS